MGIPSPLVHLFFDPDTSSIILLFLTNDNVISLLPVSKEFYKSAFYTLFKPSIQDRIRVQSRMHDCFIALCSEAEGLTFSYWNMDLVFGRYIIRKELRKVEFELTCFPCLEEEGNAIFEIQYLDSKMFRFTFGAME